MKDCNYVFVVIINYNSGKIIETAIKSINEDSIAVRIIVLDNNSTDDSLIILSKIFDTRVEVIQSKTNFGFAGGCNVAFEYIKKEYGAAEYIFLFNPDAIANPDIIYKLKQTLDCKENIAVVSPKITLLNGKSWYEGAMINWKKLMIYNIPKVIHNEIRTIDVFNGCAALLKVSAMEKVGKFDENFFMYYDEAEYSERLIKNGFEIYYDPNIIIQHDVSYTTRDQSYIKTYYMTRNKFLFFMKYSPYNSLKTFIIISKNIFRNIISLAINCKFKNIFYALLGICHVVTRRYGRL